jgi:hypothetical protein
MSAPTEAERVAALQQQAADDYARAQTQRAANEAAAAQQLAQARIHAQEAAAARR